MQPKRTAGQRIFVGIAALLLCAAIAFAFFIGMITISIGSLHRALHTWALVTGTVGAFCIVISWALKRRLPNRIGSALVFGAILLVACHSVGCWAVSGRLPRIRENPYSVPYGSYEPFRRGNLLPTCDAPAEFHFKDGVPRIATAYALYPIAGAAIQALSTREAYGRTKRSIVNTGSDSLFFFLTRPEDGDTRRDAALSLKPSDAQIADARAAGAHFQLTPIARDAFVFFVHADNPVRNLTSDQIRAIYSGQATTWRDVGVDFNAKLMPFQRNKNSGSQTTLERIMGDTPIMPPIEEDRLGGMGDIFRDVAEYRNHRGALGFSFRYYATTLLSARKVRLLAIDGVEPTPENIRNGTYPFVTDAYLTTVGSPTGDVARLAGFLRSPEGRALVEKIGYISPAPDAPALTLP